MTTQEATCPSHCRFSDSYTLSEKASERYPIRIDVKYGIQDFIEEAMWRTNRIKDKITDAAEVLRENGDFSEEQLTYWETFDPDIEDFHLKDSEITFHFGYERRCGFITNEGETVWAGGTVAEARVPHRDRCRAREISHPRNDGHDFEPYPTPLPNEG